MRGPSTESFSLAVNETKPKMKGTIFKRKQKGIYKDMHKCRKQKKTHIMFRVRVEMKEGPMDQQSFFFLTKIVKIGGKIVLESSMNKTDH